MAFEKDYKDQAKAAVEIRLILNQGTHKGSLL